MQNQLYKILPLFLPMLFAIGWSKAAYVGKPELVDYNFANANICEKTNLKVKFDHQDMTAGNIFTVEIAVGGDFNGQVFSMVGSLAQTGSAQNVFLTVTFPASVLAGGNYRLRVKASSPVTYSNQLNDFAFSVSKTGVSDPDVYPEGYWRGYVYSWVPTTPEVITDGNTQDIFNSGNYLGYIAEDTLSFDFNWGETGMAPGNLPDTNRVCGSYRDFYSIRFRRKINFEAGYYIFGGGGDDGFRMSIDGGATWLVNMWSDHQFLGQMHNNACGVFVPAGPKNVVVEYYENKTHSRVRVIIKKTGDPSVNPISITNPTDGAIICSQAAPFQMTANPMGGFQWSGPGVSANGMFNPAVAGVGFRTISYETGYVAFGSNCLKTTSVTVNIVAGFSAAFSGLDSAYCPDVQLVNLVPQVAGGTFFGPAVSGTNFSPSQLSPGVYEVGYTLNAGTGCGNDTIRKTVRIRPLPDAGFADLPDSVCKGSGNLSLVPTLSGGTFSGPGVIPSNQQWIPSILTSGFSYDLKYTLVVNGCSNESVQSVFVLDKVKPSVVMAPIKSAYCTSDEPFVPVSNPASRFFLNGTVVTKIRPSELAAGNYELKAVYTPATNVECIDSASARVSFQVIANPKPDLGADQEIELGTSLSLDPKLNLPYTWTSTSNGISFENSQPVTFGPLETMTITVLASDPTGTCSGSDDVRVTVRPKVEIPNLFTPNGDAHNQDWRIKGAYPNMRITIFDRWGKEIYSGVTKDDLAWNGSGAKKNSLYFYLVEHPTDGRTWNGWLMVGE